MSTPLEIANREADEAELENPDGEEAAEAADAEQETEPEPETETAAFTERDLAKMQEKIDNEDTRHKKRLAEVLGDQFEHYKECPLCQVAGFVLPYPPGAVEPLQRAAILAAMGDDPLPELKQAPEAKPCPVCDAQGETLTGSKNSLHRTKLCQPCDGKGWMDGLQYTTWQTQQAERDRQANLTAQGPQLSAVAPIQPQPYPDFGVPFVPLPDGVPDQYKRPAGHPNWGWTTRADGSAI